MCYTPQNHHIILINTSSNHDREQRWLPCIPSPLATDKQIWGIYHAIYFKPRRQEICKDKIPPKTRVGCLPNIKLQNTKKGNNFLINIIFYVCSTRHVLYGTNYTNSFYICCIYVRQQMFMQFSESLFSLQAKTCKTSRSSEAGPTTL